MGDPSADKKATGKVKGHAFDPTDMRVYEFFIQGAPNPKDLEGVEDNSAKTKGERCRKRKKYYKEDETI